MKDYTITQGRLPIYPEFERLKDEERRLVYKKAYRAHMNGKTRDQQKSLERLWRYIEIAGWSNEELKTMQAAAMTPVH